MRSVVDDITIVKMGTSEYFVHLVRSLPGFFWGVSAFLSRVEWSRDLMMTSFIENQSELLA